MTTYKIDIELLKEKAKNTEVKYQYFTLSSSIQDIYLLN
ncbi:MAG: hypothetical protein ACI93S_001184 [Ancylomarina sp.]|jgi:hypothetical protein